MKDEDLERMVLRASFWNYRSPSKMDHVSSYSLPFPGQQTWDAMTPVARYEYVKENVEWDHRSWLHLDSADCIDDISKGEIEYDTAGLLEYGFLAEPYEHDCITLGEYLESECIEEWEYYGFNSEADYVASKESTNATS